MPKLTKTIQNKLRELADSLPVINDARNEKRLIKGAEILSWETIKEIDGVKIDPERVYLYNSPVFIYWNHYRRMRDLYVKYGADEVRDYVRKIKEMIEQNQDR